MKRKTIKVNIFILLVFLMPQILGVALGLFQAFVAPIPMWLLLMAGQISIFICILLYAIFARKTIKEIFPLRKIGWKTILWTIVLSICVMPVTTVINLISQFFTTNAMTDVMMQLDEIPMWVLFVVIAVMPPIFEEIGFRGIALQNYRKNGVLLGVVLSAVFFGLMHGNLNQFCYATAIGFIAALMVEATGSILSSMILHFIINGTNVGMIIVSCLATGKTLSELYSEEATMLEGNAYMMTLMASLMVYLPIAIVCCIVGFFVFKQLCRSTGRWEYMKAIFQKRIILPEKERTIDVWLILAILVGLITLILNEIIV